MSTGSPFDYNKRFGNATTAIWNVSGIRRYVESANQEDEEEEDKIAGEGRKGYFLPLLLPGDRDRPNTITHTRGIKRPNPVFKSTTR